MSDGKRCGAFSLFLSHVIIFNLIITVTFTLTTNKHAHIQIHELSFFLCSVRSNYHYYLILLREQDLKLNVRVSLNQMLGAEWEVGI